MKLTMLGTGNAVVTECYNTCFVLSEEGKHFLVDGGGGNTLLRQLKSAGIDWRDIREIYVTHKHVDHVMGIIWMIRLICQNMRRGNYEGEAKLYAHRELMETVCQISRMLLEKKDMEYLGARLHLIPLEDGDEHEILGHRTGFFDIHSTKAKQYGFTMYLDGEEKLTCCGDEPFNEANRAYAQGSKWLLHEAFCLHSQADVFKPYQKHHSTVKDACQLAEELGVKNLVLYHTEDQNIKNRKALYLEEGRQYYSGSLYVPEDLETLEL